MQFLYSSKFDFVGKRYIFFGITGFFILLGIVSLIVRGGPNYGIDFTGGTLLQISFEKPVQLSEIRKALSDNGLTGVEMQNTLDNMSVTLRKKQKDVNADEFLKSVKQILSTKLADNKMTVERNEYVGPAVGKHLVNQAFMAIVFSMLGIIVYVALRFHSGIWGFAGVFALFHDVFIVFGLFSVFNKEITLTVIAALLTLAGYSINDTIVVYDRIRDNLKYMSKDSLYNIINTSINQTLSRTIITALTVFIVVLALFLFGGEVIHDFAFAMLVGVFVGCYSSVYVASPMIFEWEEWKKRRAAKMTQGRRG